MNTGKTKEKKLRRTNNRAIQGVDLLFCVLAFTFARIGLVHQFYTVGVAYVGSLCLKKSLGRGMSFFSILGLVSLGEFNLAIVKYIFIYVFIQMVREYFYLIKYKLTMYQQLFVTGGVVSIVGGIASTIQGLNVYGIGISVFEGIISMLLAYILSFGIEVLREQRKTPLTTKESMSMVLVFACVLTGCVDLYVSVPLFKEIYLRDVMVFIVLIGVIRLGGMNIGVTMGVVTSAILVMIGYIQSHMVIIYGIMSIMGGVFAPMGKIGVIIGAGIGQWIGFIVFNKGGVDITLVGAYLVASLVSLVLPRSYFGMANWFVEKNLEESEQVHLERIQHMITQKLKCVVSGFEKLGKSFYSPHALKIDYTRKDLQNIIEDTKEKMCKQCSMYPFCWKQDIDNTQVYVHQMMEVVRKKGMITVGDIPNHFKCYCIQAETFAYFLSYRMDLIKQDMMWQNRFLENRALVAEELYAVANTLSSIVKEVDEELCFNKEKEKVLRENLLSEGIKLKDIMVVESKEKISYIEVYTKYCNKKADYEKRIGEVIGQTLNCGIICDKHFCDQEKGCRFKFNIKDRYRIVAGCAVCSKGAVSGDVHSFMELGDNQYLLALADGMGSGVLAYEESATAIEMLEDFIGSGFKNELAVKMINAALILKSTKEVFSTIDITLIDKQTGMAELLKAGAATTFIVRQNRVMSIQSDSLPVGILREVDLEVKKEQLEDKDLLIMVTDGMLQSSEGELGKEETFKHFIKEAGTANPQYMADYLMQKSKDLLGVGERDDMTIIVAKIWKEY